MSGNQCNRCGIALPPGTVAYEVAVRVRSTYDEVVADVREETTSDELSQILADISTFTEEELTRQIYEDDVFIMCPACKEEFLDDIYSKIRPKAVPERGRAHLIH